MEEIEIIPSEQDEEVVQEETPVVEPEPKLVIRTGGKWVLFEEAVKQDLEVGKTYHLHFGSNCEVMISADKPTSGIITNEVTYTKEENKHLWVKTGI